MQDAWNNVVSFFDNQAGPATYGQWLGMLGAILGGVIVGKFLQLFFRRQAKHFGQSERFRVLGIFFQSLTKPSTLFFLSMGLIFGGRIIFPLAKRSTDLYRFYNNVSRTIAAIAVTWAAYKLVDVIAYLMRHLTQKTETTLDDLMVPMIRKTLRVFVVAAGGVFIAQNIFDWKIGALLTGLGIGGLAFALAAKDMLANLFGSVTIFTDRPFTMGERIKIKGYDGMVEEVGFRTTRLRLLNGHLVSLPNGMLSNEAIENISRRPFIKRSMEVTVTYDTSPEKVQRAVAILRDMLDAREGQFAEDRPGMVWFGDMAATALVINVLYWYAPPDWAASTQFDHEFNMELLQRFNDEGIEFAFPTQTLYLKQDDPLEITGNPK